LKGKEIKGQKKSTKGEEKGGRADEPESTIFSVGRANRSINKKWQALGSGMRCNVVKRTGGDETVVGIARKNLDNAGTIEFKNRRSYQTISINI